MEIRDQRFYEILLKNGRRVRLVWMIGQNAVFSFNLYDFSRITDMEINNYVIARELIRHKDCVISPESLLSLLQYYSELDEIKDLKSFVELIYADGLYSPFQPNLNIRIEEPKE